MPDRRIAEAQELHLLERSPTYPRGMRTSLDYQVRDARITDVDRIINLLADSTDEFGDAFDTGPAVANLLRQLIYLPQAAVLVAEADRRIVGLVVLALRPSVRAGGMIGNIDLLAIEGRHEESGVRQTLVNDASRSARNKGCLVIEATQPLDRAARERWLELGFEQGPALIVRPVGGRAAVRN